MLDNLLSIAIRIFMAKPSFLALHSVTGGYALLHIMPHVTQKVLAVKVYCLWVLAVYILRDFPALAPPPDRQRAVDDAARKARWETCRKAALVSTHVHIIKMMWACWHLQQRFPHEEMFLEAVEWQLQKGQPF